jgi:hypothetical protein
LGDWIRGARKCWPNAEGWLVTNGTYLSRCKDLDDLAVEHNIIVVISVHNSAMKAHVLDEVYATFGYCEITNKQDNKIMLRSHRGVIIELNNGGSFHQNALNNFELHDSNPENAHRQCIMSGCHHFANGKLYKCGVVELMPTLFAQNNKVAPTLYNEYRPLQLTDTITQETVDDLREKAIPQCKFCPENLVFTENNARFKNKNLNVKILSV